MHVDFTNRLNKFHAAVGAVLREKLHGFEDVYVHLLLTKCMPILFYGVDALIFSGKNLQLVTKAWNMAFRWIFGLRKFDSTRLLLKSCKTMSAKFLIHMRWLLFYNSVSVSNSLLVHNLWLWVCMHNSYRQLLSSYRLFNVDSRCLIRMAISDSFNDYCGEFEDNVVE
jgi:hypothetical protein